MADRQVDLDSFPEDFIKEEGYEFLLDDEYIVPEAVLLTSSEIDDVMQAQDKIYDVFKLALAEIIKKRDFNFLNLPSKMIDLICHSFENDHLHLLGRFDFAGGMMDLPLKLLEFNADTPTMIPESSIIQSAFYDHYPAQGQFNVMERNIEVAFNWLNIKEGKRNKTLLATSLGYKEDIANAKLIMSFAEAENFEVEYANLPDIEFANNEGVFLEIENGDSVQFDFLYKLIPWEFICFEEPDLLDILHNLITQDLLYVLNPAYSLVYQSKVFLDYVSKNYDLPYFLKSSRNPSDFSGSKYVEKVSFGRLGENITIFDEKGSVLEKTDGDFGQFEKVYQEFAHLYKDEYNEYYQLGMFNVNSKASSISFRRGEKLIIDDDCQFIPHFEIP